jgi:hypothetical protein
MSEETLIAYAVDRVKALVDELKAEGISPQAIAHALTLQAAAIAGDLAHDDSREFYEDLSSIARLLDPTEPAPF